MALSKLFNTLIVTYFVSSRAVKLRHKIPGIYKKIRVVQSCERYNQTDIMS